MPTPHPNRDLTFDELNRSRRSWLGYTGEVVDPSLIETIVEEACLAPSGSNLQPWRFTVAQGDQIDRFADSMGGNVDKAREAGTLLIVFGDPNAVEAKDGSRGFYDGGQTSRHDFAVRNGSLVAMNLMLAAWSHGVATRPMIGFEPFTLREAAKAPRQYVPVLALALGYPDITQEQSPRDRHETGDLLTFLS